MQQIKEAIRPILYETGYAEWPYSCGGTLFIVNFGGRCYGLTCKHVIGKEGGKHLFVAPRHVLARGMRPAPVHGIALIDGHENDAQDVGVIQFSSGITPDFFEGTAYVIGPRTAGPSEPAHRLMVYGFLNEKTVINLDAQSITGGYGDMSFTNLGATSSDPSLVEAVATYSEFNIKSLDGMSGAPVYDLNYNRLCGMVSRAGLKESGEARIWYIDIPYVLAVLQAVHVRLTDAAS